MRDPVAPDFVAAPLQGMVGRGAFGSNFAVSLNSALPDSCPP